MTLKEQIEAASALYEKSPNALSLTLFGHLLVDAYRAGKLLVIEDEAQAAITAHAAALIAGAGELERALLFNGRYAAESNDQRADRINGERAQAAATIAALQAELAWVKALLNEGVERGNAMMESSNAVIADLDAQLTTARLEGVRLGIGAAAQCALDWTPMPGNDRQVHGTYAQACFDVAREIRNLDPAAIVKGE